MLIAETNQTREYKLVPEGSHLAICYGIVDLGTQENPWQGEVKLQRQCRLLWELHGEDAEGNPLTLEDGRPLSLSQRYTLSLNEKAKLRKMLVSWRGSDFTPKELRGFDMRTIIGKPCLLTVTHSHKDGKTYANVENVTAVPAALKKLGVPDMINKRTYFSFGYYDQDEFDALSEGFKKVIMRSPEYAQFSRTRPASSLNDVDDDIPF
jgi:hypothetical protein